MNPWVKPVVFLFVFAIGLPYIAMKFRSPKPGKEEDYAPNRNKRAFGLPKVYWYSDYEARDVSAMRYRLRKQREAARKRAEKAEN